MTMQDTARIKTAAFCAACVAVGLTGLPRESAAQPCGAVYLTQTPPPDGASRAEIGKFLKRNRSYALSREKGQSWWQVYMFVNLRFVPSARLLFGRQNGGRLYVAFYKRVKRRWVRDNVSDVSYRRGAKILRFPFKITTDLGLARKVPYQLRITLLTRSKREIVLAVGRFLLK